MLGCNEYMIVGVLPDIAKEYHTSLSSLGYVVRKYLDSLDYQLLVIVLLKNSNGMYGWSNYFTRPSTRKLHCTNG